MPTTPRSESAASTSSSSSSSSSFSPSTASEAEQVGSQAAPDPPVPGARRVGQRNPNAAEFWGVFRLTPTRYGWQMTCTHPAHQGGKTCQKTRSNNMSGSEENTLRLLKYWAAAGCTEPSQQEHFDFFRKVLELEKEGSLPTEDDIEAMCISDWGCATWKKHSTEYHMSYAR